MDRERFDALARLLATTGSRRGALGTLIGAGVLGAGLDAEARKRNGKGRGGGGKGKSKDKNRRKRAQAEQIPSSCCSTGNCTPGAGKNLYKCCYEDANFAGRNFKGANVGLANFSGANLTNANFAGANMGKACLVDADLTGAVINGSTNQGGVIRCRTTLPDGNIDNSGCANGTPCCPTCDDENPCDDGEVCCRGACKAGDCCTNTDCDDPNEPVCVRNSCSPCSTDGQCGDLTCCEPICTDTDTDPDNCGECGRECAANEVCSNGFTCQDDDCLPVTEIEGNVERAPNGGLTLEADTSGGFGAFAFGVPNNTTLADIATMGSAFQFGDGTSCGAGTPRFCTIFTGRPDCVCAQFPTTLCNTPNASGTTGNLIGNNTPGVWFRLCAAGPTINTYAEALTEYGTEEIDYIFLVADSSNGNQTVTVEPCITLGLDI